MAITGIKIISLGIAVVKAASSVIMSTVTTVRFESVIELAVIRCMILKYSYLLHKCLKQAESSLRSNLQYSVHAFRPVSSSCATRFVVAITSHWRAEDAVYLLPVQSNRCTEGARQVIIPTNIRATCSATWRGLCQMITATRLVIDDRDKAGRPVAEFVLRSGIGNASRRYRPNISRGIV